MSPWTAVAWREARIVGREVIALAALSVLALPIVALASPSARESGAPIVLAVIFSATAALILGAGTFAGDAAPAFLASRAIGPLTSLSARMSVRASGVAALAILAGAIAWAASPGAPEALAHSSRAPSVLGPFLALAFLSAALASAYSKKAVSAAIAGTAVAMPALMLALPFMTTGGEPAAALASAAATVALPLLLLAVVVSARWRADVGFRPERALALAVAVPLAAIPVALAAWLAIGGLVTRARLDAAAAEWHAAAAESGEIPAFLEASASPAALRVDELSRGLGAPLIARGVGAPPIVPLARVLAGGSPLGVADVPDLARRHLEDHRSEIDELELLLARETITWPAWRGVDCGGANFGWTLLLAKLLACDALVQDDAGSPALAARAMAAIRGLEASARSHPSANMAQLAPFLVAVEARTARSLHAPPSEPQDAPALEQQAWDSMLRAAEIDLDVARGRLAPSWRAGLSGIPPVLRVAETLWAPVARAQAASEVRAAAAEARRLGGLPPCDRFRPAAPSTHRNWSSQWSWDVAGRLRAATTARLEWELTRAVLAVRSRGVPESGRIPSEICPGRTWSVSRLPGGGWTIAPWPDDTEWDWHGRAPSPHVEPAP